MSKIETAKHVFNKRAAEYAEKYMDVSAYQEALDIFCKMPRLNAAVLEIACGPGNITKCILEKRPDIRLTGLDIAPNMVELAKANNPSATFMEMDCRDVNELSDPYEAVLCGFALPYLTETEAINFIGDAANLLPNGGALYISTMEGEPGTSGVQTSSYGDRVYVNYHQAGYLTDALNRVGFSVVHCQRIDIPGENSGKIKDLIIVAELKR